MKKPLWQRIEEKYAEIKQLQKDEAPPEKLQCAFRSLRHLQQLEADQMQKRHDEEWGEKELSWEERSRQLDEDIARLEQQIREKSPPLNLDPHTFGNSPAAVILINKLNYEFRDITLARRIIKFIQRTQTGFRRIGEIEDNLWFNTFRILWKKERMSMIDFHPEIDTYVANVIDTDAKEWLRTTFTPKQLAKLPDFPKMDREGNMKYEKN